MHLLQNNRQKTYKPFHRHRRLKACLDVVIIANRKDRDINLSSKDARVKTRVIKESEHDKFQLAIKLDSSPILLEVESKDTKKSFTDYKAKEPNFKLGIVFFDKGRIVFKIYPLSNLNFIHQFCSKNILEKREGFTMDLRRTRENLNVLKKIYYYQRLNKERKVKYLAKKGFFANVNVTVLLVWCKKNNIKLEWIENATKRKIN